MAGNITNLPPRQNQNDPEIVEKNRLQLQKAFNCLYATSIYTDDAAKHRGKAIRSINSLCRKLGFHDLVRED